VQNILQLLTINKYPNRKRVFFTDGRETIIFDLRMDGWYYSLHIIRVTLILCTAIVVHCTRWTPSFDHLFPICSICIQCNTWLDQTDGRSAEIHTENSLLKHSREMIVYSWLDLNSIVCQEFLMAIEFC